MTEFLFALGVIAVSVAGLALGLLLRRGPIRTSCAGLGLPEHLRCDDCPLKRMLEEGKA